MKEGGVVSSTGITKNGAVASISGVIRDRVRRDGVCNVIIAGGTCSGKSTLANNLISLLSAEFTATLVKQDDYFKDIRDVPKTGKGYLMDSPNSFHTSEFRQDCEQLVREGAAYIPEYNVAENKRVGKNTPIKRSQVNVFEGLHTIRLLGGFLPGSLTIFVDTPQDVCVERRVRRDTALYGVAEERVREHFADCIAPMYDSYIAPQREQADLTAEGA